MWGVKLPYCQQCGEEIDSDAKFCDNCGAPIKAGKSEKVSKTTRSKGSNTLDIEENIEGALTYVLGWLTGIVFLVLEKKSDFVRFHAMQSIVTFLPLSILTWILRWVGRPTWGYSHYSPGIPALMYLSWIIGLGMFLVWLLLMFKAYQGERFKLPVIGDISEDLLSSV